MANKYINIYAGNPTSGGTDATQVSTDGANTSPIAVTLDASKAESYYYHHDRSVDYGIDIAICIQFHYSDIFGD